MDGADFLSAIVKITGLLVAMVTLYKLLIEFPVLRLARNREAFKLTLDLLGRPQEARHPVLLEAWHAAIWGKSGVRALEIERLLDSPSPLRAIDALTQARGLLRVATGPDGTAILDDGGLKGGLLGVRIRWTFAYVMTSVIGFLPLLLADPTDSRRLDENDLFAILLFVVFAPLALWLLVVSARVGRAAKYLKAQKMGAAKQSVSTAQAQGSTKPAPDLAAQSPS